MPIRHPARVLWLIPCVYFVFVAAEFAALTHLALSATAAGESAFTVGLLSAGLWTGILVSSAWASQVSRHLGFGYTFVLGCAMAFASVVSLGATERFALWVGSAAVMGLGGGLVWVVGESWLARSAPSAQRGLYIGWFEAAVGLGLMAGPLAIPLSAAIDASPLTLSMGAMGAALAVSLLLLQIDRRSSRDIDETEQTTETVSWQRVAYPLLAISLLSGILESGVSALLPSISMRLGATMDSAALLGTVIGAGSALLQPPAGQASDRWGARNIILLSWLTLMSVTSTLAFVAPDPGYVLWIAGFVLGGVGGAVYTLSIIELGHRLTGSALVKAISALVISYSLGTAAAPPLGGLIFDRLGLVGFAGALAVLCLVGAVMSWLRLFETAQPAKKEKALGGRP